MTPHSLLIQFLQDKPSESKPNFMEFLIVRLKPRIHV